MRLSLIHIYIQDRIRDWLVQPPELGFLFPAFNDRNMDIHSLLYYSKNADEVDEVITDKLLGCRMPLPAKSQKETFNAIVEESLGLECDYEAVSYTHLLLLCFPYTVLIFQNNDFANQQMVLLFLVMSIY